MTTCIQYFHCFSFRQLTEKRMISRTFSPISRSSSHKRVIGTTYLKPGKEELKRWDSAVIDETQPDETQPTFNPRAHQHSMWLEGASETNYDTFPANPPTASDQECSLTAHSVYTVWNFLLRVLLNTLPSVLSETSFCGLSICAEICWNQCWKHLPGCPTFKGQYTIWNQFFYKSNSTFSSSCKECW